MFKIFFIFGGIRMKTKDVNYKSLNNLTDEQTNALNSIGSGLLSLGFVGGAVTLLVGTGVVYGMSSLIEKGANKLLNKRLE